MSFRHFPLPVSIRIKGRELKKLYCLLQLLLHAALALIFFYFPNLGICKDYPLEPHLRLGMDLPSSLQAAKKFTLNRGTCRYLQEKLDWAKIDRCKTICDWDEVPGLNCSAYEELVTVNSVSSSLDTVYILVSLLQTPERRLAAGTTVVIPHAVALPVNFRVDLSWKHPRAYLCDPPSGRFCINGVSSILVLDKEDAVVRFFDSADFSLTVAEVLEISRGTPTEQTFLEDVQNSKSTSQRYKRTYVLFKPLMLLGSKIDADVRCYSEERYLRKRIKGELPDGLKFSKPVCTVRFAWIGQARRVDSTNDFTIFRNEVHISSLPGSGSVCVVEEQCILRFLLVWMLLISCPTRVLRWIITKHLGLLSRIYKREIFYNFSVRRTCESMAMNAVVLAVNFSKAQKEKPQQEAGSSIAGSAIFSFLDLSSPMTAPTKEGDNHYLPQWRLQERLDKAAGFYFTDDVIRSCVDFIMDMAFEHLKWNQKYNRVLRSHETPVARTVLGALGYNVETPKNPEEEREYVTASVFLGMCFATWHVNYVEVCHLFDNRRPVECTESIFTTEYIQALRIRYQAQRPDQVDFAVHSLEDMSNLRKNAIEDLQQVNMQVQRQLSELQTEMQKMQLRVDRGPDQVEESEAEDSKPEPVKTWRDWIADAQSKADKSNDLADGGGAPIDLSDIDSSLGNAIGVDSPAGTNASANNATPPSVAVASGFAQVYRDGDWVMVSTKDLLPGDLLRQGTVSPPSSSPVPTSVEAPKVEKAEETERVEEAQEAAEKLEPSKAAEKLEPSKASREVGTVKDPPEAEEDNSSPEDTRRFVSVVRKLQAVLNRWEEKQLEDKPAHKEAQSLIQDIVKLPKPRKDILKEEFKISSESVWDAEVGRYKELSKWANKPTVTFWHEIGFHGHQDDSKNVNAPPSPRIAELQVALRQRSLLHSFQMPAPMSFHPQEQEEKLKTFQGITEDGVQDVIEERMAQLERAI